MSNFNWPSITTSAGPIQFVLDGSSEQASKDTVTPSNSKPLPVEVLNSSGAAADFATATKQDAQTALLTTISGKDFSTATKQDAQTALLTTISGKDFSTATRQDAQTALLTTISGIDYSTSAKQDSQTTLLTTISGKDFATSAKQDSQSTLIGSVTESAPASDTASSGLNGRLQRIAQRITSLIAQIPATLGQKTMANSMAVTVASDQSTLAVAVVSANATVGSSTSVGTSAVLETAPADAVGFYIYAMDSNTDNVYWIQGATATTANGFPFAPGRSEYIPCGASVSLISGTAGQGYRLQWVRK